MAKASISVDQDQFLCSVCLDLLKDPVAIPCGHSFCKVCINDCWDQDDKSGVYRCPQCRDTFTPRPVLRKNNMLAEVVEKLKKMIEVQAASPAHCYAGPGDVECDFCTGRKHKAVKSCLMYVAFLCETHLKPHVESRVLKKHKLVQASGNLQEMIYSQHDKVLEIVCGHCYWEVERSSEGYVLISVSYKDIRRKGQGNECWSGGNNQSWSLRCSSSSLSFHHNTETDLRVPSPSRIGVYVDHSAGTLFFYSISDTMKLLHRVHTTFTQPLYAGFILPYCGSTVRDCVIQNKIFMM